LAEPNPLAIGGNASPNAVPAPALNNVSFKLLSGVNCNAPIPAFAAALLAKRFAMPPFY
jgi:hypothetical protein